MLPCWACGTSTNAREDAWSLSVIYCPPCYNQVERPRPVPRARTRTSKSVPMIDDERPSFGASSPKPAKRQKRVTFCEEISFSEPAMDAENIKNIATQLDQLTRTNFSYRFKLQRKYRKLQKLQEQGGASGASSFLAIDMLMAKNKQALEMIEDSFKVTRELLDRVSRGSVTVYDYGILREELVKIKADLQETERLVNEVKQFSEEAEAEVPKTKAKLKEPVKTKDGSADTPMDLSEIKMEHETFATKEKKKKQQRGIVESHRLILEKLKHLSELNKEREELEMQIQLRDHLRLIDENQSVLDELMDADDFERFEKIWLGMFKKICAANDLGVPRSLVDDCDDGSLVDEGTKEELEQQKSQRNARKTWQKQTEKFLEKVKNSKYSSSSSSSSSSDSSDSSKKPVVHRVRDDKGISQEEKIERMESDLATAEQLMKILRELEKLDVGNSTAANGKILEKTRCRLTADDLVKRLEGLDIDDQDGTGGSSQTPAESICRSDDSSRSNNDVNGRRPSAAPAEVPSDSLASITFTGKQEKLVKRVVRENIRATMQRCESRMR